MDSSKAAVFVQSTGLPSLEDAKKLQVRGPAGLRADGTTTGCCETATVVMDGMSNVGFQATNMGMATTLIQTKMLAGRQFRKTVLQTEEEQIKKRYKYERDDTPHPERQFDREKLPPLIFLGIVSSMLRNASSPPPPTSSTSSSSLPPKIKKQKKTIIHDSLVFMAREALLDVMVISGGGPENDLRNLYDAAVSAATSSTISNSSTEEVGMGDDSKGFRAFINCLIETIHKRQHALYVSAMEKVGSGGGEGIVSDDVEAGRVCEWALGPSNFWDLVGSSLVTEITKVLLSQSSSSSSTTFGSLSRTALEVCQGNSMLYWCHVNGIPVFSPSISDGDMAMWIREWEITSTNTNTTLNINISSSQIKKRRWHYATEKDTPSSPSIPTTTTTTPFVFDLTRDIGRLNKISAWAKNPTCMLIFGGGVVKHHVCNANLFRNGADFSVYVNSAQEYDGSDGGARPDEAISWGKIKKTAEKNCAVKVFGEVSLIVPLLVAHGFGKYVQQGVASTSSTPTQ